MGNTNDDLTRELYARMTDEQLTSIYTKSTPSDSHKRLIEAEMRKRRIATSPPGKPRPTPSTSPLGKSSLPPAAAPRTSAPPPPAAMGTTIPQRPTPFTVKRKSSGMGCVTLIILYILFRIFKDSFGH